jgi:uncharacterized protein YggE
MKRRAVLLILLNSVLPLAANGVAQAQLPGAAGAASVTGSGTTVLTRSPKTLRLRIDLSGSAKSTKDALAKLKSIGDAATAKLTELGAEKETVKLSPPRIADASNDQRRQMEMMVRQRMRAGGKKPKAQPEPPVVVSASLTAEWKLAGKDAAALLIEGHDLEESVKAADLAGSKHKSEEASEEEQEMADEMADQFGMQNDGQPKPGQPLFVYVAKVDEAERAKALSSAFAKARAEAEQLAAAAGVQIGPLRGLQSQAAPSDIENYGYSRYNGMRQYLMSQMSAAGEGQDALPVEAVGTHPGEVKMTFAVYASFDLAGSK